ncbi:MAG: sugar phosphate isomerase/epimerase family protein [Candidatus Neoclostridium sp.]
MRKLIINVDLGIDLMEFFDRAAKVGWDGVFTGWNEEKGNKYIAERIKADGLIYQSVHAPFNKCDRLWEEDERGDAEVERQKKCLRDSAEAGVDLVVMHAIIGMDKCTPTNIGVDRFGKILDEAQSLGVKVAVENTEGECYVEKLFADLKSHPALGFCIDTGHEMCYNYSQDIIGKYGDKLIATHLNDNMGVTGEKITWYDDAHMMPFDGIADWDGIARRIKKTPFDGPLTFELNKYNRPERHTHDRYAQLDADGYLSLALEKAKKFRVLLER